MKITKHIFIYIILICIAAQGMTLSQICIGPDHYDSDIDWASNCHTQTNDSHNSHDAHKTSFGHKDNDCIDISFTSIAASGYSGIPDEQLNITKPIILKPATANHPFSSFDFSKLKTNLFPVFTNMATLSIASTILIV